MKLSGVDALNIIVGFITIGTALAGMISTLFAILVGVLIFSWFAYYRIPWAHKTWKTEQVRESVQSFYSFSKLLHGAIVYSLVILIASSLTIGVIAKTGPSVLTSDTAEYVWNNKTWKTKGVSSTTIPQELAASKKEEQPLAVIVNNGILKATPMHESLTAIADSYGNAFFQYATVVFLFALVAAIGLYPMEMLANARGEHSGD